MQQYPRITKKQLILSLFVALILIVVWMFSRYSYIEITVNGAENKQITYNLAKDGVPQEDIVSNEKTIKKLVTKGDYEITTSVDNQSGFNIASAGGFLGTSSVKAELGPKKRIEYIGDNPRPCMILTKSGLVSYGCGDQLVQTYFHAPATKFTPTFTQKVDSIYDGQVEGTFNLKGVDYIAVKGPSDGNGQAPHAAYELVGSIETGRAHVLTGLDNEATYSIEPYGEGVIAINTELNQALYFPSLESSPERIDVIHPDTKTSNSPYIYSTSGEKLIIGFSGSDQVDNHSEEEEDTPKIDTTIVEYSKGTKRVFKFDTLFEDIQVCGSDRLCTLNTGRLTIYDTSQDKPKTLGVVNSVSSFKTQGSKIVIVRDQGVINFDTISMSGSIDYNFGDYQQCGIQMTKGGYILCARDRRGGQVAWRVTPGETNPLDSYVSKLLEVEGVDKISAYGDTVFISPDLGDYKYNESTNSFGYDQEIEKTVNSRIRNKISELKAESKYKFINPLDQQN